MNCGKDITGAANQETNILELLKELTGAANQETNILELWEGVNRYSSARDKHPRTMGRV